MGSIRVRKGIDVGSKGRSVPFETRTKGRWIPSRASVDQNARAGGAHGGRTGCCAAADALSRRGACLERGGGHLEEETRKKNEGKRNDGRDATRKERKREVHVGPGRAATSTMAMAKRRTWTDDEGRERTTPWTIHTQGPRKQAENFLKESAKQPGYGSNILQVRTTTCHFASEPRGESDRSRLARNAKVRRNVRTDRTAGPEEDRRLTHDGKRTLACSCWPRNKSTCK